MALPIPIPIGKSPINKNIIRNNLSNYTPTLQYNCMNNEEDFDKCIIGSPIKLSPITQHIQRSSSSDIWILSDHSISKYNYQLIEIKLQYNSMSKYSAKIIKNYVHKIIESIEATFAYVYDNKILAIFPSSLSLNLLTIGSRISKVLFSSELNIPFTGYKPIDCEISGYHHHASKNIIETIFEAIGSSSISRIEPNGSSQVILKQITDEIISHDFVTIYAKDDK